MPADTLRDLWSTNFHGSPTCRSSAPGRVNLIGEHTDYNQGFVLPAAISLRIHGLFRLASASTKLVSTKTGATSLASLDAELPARGWIRYVLGCARALRDEVGALPPPIEGAIETAIPSGSGLSSSAAFNVLLISAWNYLNDLRLPPDRIAEVAWLAETRYVGVSCGRMDPIAVSLGVQGHALFLDTRSLLSEAILIPGQYAIAVLDTTKPRSLVSSAYNQRVSECRRAASALQVDALRDATIEMLERAKQVGLDDVAYRRARHVITENERTLAACDALKRADSRTIGRLFRESHESLSSDYEVSCPELNAMARAASMAPGCVGARMTGAGFGGCCVALVHKELFKEFENSVRVSYGMYGFREPHIHEVAAVDGCRTAPFE